MITYQPVINGCYGLLPPVAQRHLAALPSSTLISSVAVAKSFTMCTFLFGVCLKMLCTPKPNGFADHYPYEKWLFHWEY